MRAKVYAHKATTSYRTWAFKNVPTFYSTIIHQYKNLQNILIFKKTDKRPLICHY